VGKTNERSDFMPTTNISQNLSSILKAVGFSRKDQLYRVASYVLALSMPKHVNETRISNHIPISQSSISRTLSTDAISTQSITSARVNYISEFIDSTTLKPKYLILDETVIKRYGKKKIEKLGKFYSSIEGHSVKGIELLSSLLWIRHDLYFPLFSDMADVKDENDQAFETSTDKFISILEKVEFKDLILLTDSGITCAEIFAEAKKKGYTLIGRIRKNMNVILNGVPIPLKKLSEQTSELTSVVVYIPEYTQQVKLVIDNRLSTRMEEKDKNGRVILCSDISKGSDEILEHYSKRTYIELSFKYAKNELGLKSMVYSARSMLRHVEFVSLFFALWMISQFFLNVKDRLGLRDFVEQIGISCFVILLRIISKDLRYVQKFEIFHRQTCII